MLFDSLMEMISYYAEKTPEKAVLYYEEKGGRRSMSYQELQSAVLKAADEFGPQKCVAFLIGELSVNVVIRLFGAITSGKRVVLLDENIPEDTLKYLIRLTEADKLVGDEELTESLAPFVCRIKAKQTNQVLFFTSGTTSRSKAVVLTEKSLMRSAYNGGELLPLKEDDILLAMLPVNHVFGFVCGLLWALNSGAAVAIGRGPRHYADDFRFFSPTAVSLVPLLVGFCLKYQVFNPELSLLLIGAGDCPKNLIDAVKAQGIRVSFGYGLTETSSGVALSLGDDPYAFTICPDFTVKIADDGEILIHSPETVMKGYYMHPDDTKKALQDGWLHSGDLGRLDEEGRLYVTGRKKEMIVLQDGTKIFLPEYESSLISALTEQDLAVISKDHKLMLVIASRAGTEKEIQEKIRPVMEQYPRGQQIQRIIRTDKPLPRTATGKLKRYEIEMMGEIS